MADTDQPAFLNACTSTAASPVIMWARALLRAACLVAGQRRRRARTQWWMSDHRAPHRWGDSMSRTGEIAVSVVTVVALATAAAGNAALEQCGQPRGKGVGAASSKLVRFGDDLTINDTADLD